MPTKDKDKQKAYHKAYYAKNKDIVKAKTKRFNAQTKERNRLIVDGYLTSHPCVDCGEADIVVLEFDHVRGKKRKAVSVMVREAGVKTLMAEIAKCDVRCANCHRRITVKRRKQALLAQSGRAAAL